MSRDILDRAGRAAAELAIDHEWFLYEIDRKFSLVENAADKLTKCALAREIALLYMIFVLSLKVEKESTEGIVDHFYVDCMLLAEMELIPASWFDLRRQNLSRFLGEELIEEALALLPRLPGDDPEVNVRGELICYTPDGFAKLCADPEASSLHLSRLLEDAKGDG